VTQAFNTTTSMGRLTLNVLLSFAQFEREVTGERIRDKIAASKKKGMWMGGTLPFGYAAPIDPKTRALVIVPQEAELVRAIFARYLELGSMNEVMDWLDALGHRTRVTTSRRGKIRGGVTFGRGALNHLLKNRHYLGQIVHKGISHPGAHLAIVDEALFEAVQQKIAANTHARRERPLRSGSALLKGLLFDAEGEPMSPSFGYGKSGRLYRYYVSAPLQQGKRSADDDVARRVAAPLLEETVRQAVLRIARAADDAAIRTAVARIELDLRCITVHLRRAAISKRQNPPLQDLALAASRLLPGEDAELDADATLIRVRIPVLLRVRGGRTWLTQGDAAFLGRKRIDPVMTKALRQAHALVRSAGVHPSRRAPVPAKGPDNPYHRKLAPLAFLSPAIQRAILEGRQPAELTLNRLIASELPLAWNEQERLFGL
jgi:site-specific DNA recombinase